MRICVFSMYDSAYKEVADVSVFSNFKEYCHLNGYDLRYFFLKDNELAASWFKIPNAIKILKEGNYDWLFYMDADCLFMDTTFRLENLIDDDYFFICPEHKDDSQGKQKSIIGSHFLVKNCQQSLDFLEEVWSAPDDFSHHGNTKEDSFNIHPWEQTQLNISAKKEKYKNQIKILGGRAINAFWPQNSAVIIKSFTGCNLQIYSPGDFIAHFAGYPNQERVRLMSEAHDYLCGGEFSAHIVKRTEHFYKIVFVSLFHSKEFKAVVKDASNGDLMSKSIICEGKECVPNEAFYVTLNGSPSSLEGKEIEFKIFRDEKVVSQRILELKANSTSMKKT